MSNLLRRFRPASSKSKHDLPVRSHRGRSAAARGTDVEAAVLRPRILGREAEHKTGEREESLERLVPQDGTAQASLADKYEHADEAYINEILADMEEVADRARENREDEEQALIVYAKRKIMEASSNADLLLKAELLIGEDWLGKIEMINGNIYRIGAFVGLVDVSEGGKRTKCAGVARFIGCVMLALVQIFGPLLIFLSCVYGQGREQEKLFKWENWNFGDLDAMLGDWNVIPTTKLLGICFLEAFILNALFVCQDAKQAEEKVWDIFGHLKRNTPNYEVHGSFYLFMGAFINNWLVIMCTLDAYMIIGGSRTPSELLLDSLGLLFLFNLDDIDGALGFVDEDDWPGLRIGWIHSEIVQAPSEEDETNMGFKEKCNRTVNMASYSISFYFCVVASVVMPIMAALTPFTQIVPDD